MPLVINITKKVFLFLTLTVLIVGPFATLISQSSAAGTPEQECEISGGTWNTQDDRCVSNAPANNFFDTAAPNGIREDIGCSSAGGWATCLSWIVYWIGPGLASLIAGLAAHFFDIVTHLSLDSNAYALDFLSMAWETVRDLANIAFIFILIYIAITIMLEADSANAMKMLATLVVMAVLVNFSFFITRVVIDGGNILGVQFYNRISADSLSKQDLSGRSTSGVKDLTSPILNTVAPQKLFNEPTFRAWATQPGVWGLTILITLSFLFISIAIIYWILAFAFLQAGIKFLLRTVGLWFVIIAAPLAFAARVLTNNKVARGWYDKWQYSLVSFSLYPAVFLFVYWIIATVSKAITGDNIYTSIFSGLSNTANQTIGFTLLLAITDVFIRMGIVIAMLYYGMKATDAIVMEGGTMASTITNKVRGFTTGAAKKVATKTYSGAKYVGGSAVGYGYRKSVGKWANDLDESLKTSRKANQDTFYGRMAYRARKKVLEPAADVRFGGVKSYTELHDYKEKRAVDQSKNIRDIENTEKTLRTEERIKLEERQVLAAVGTPGVTWGAKDTARLADLQKDKEKDEQRINELSTREIETIDPKALATIAAVLKENQIKKIESSNHFNEKEKETIIKEYHEKSPDAPQQKATKELELLKKIHAALKHPTVAPALQQNIVKKISSGENISGKDIKEVLEELDDKITAMDATIQAKGSGKGGAKAEERAELGNLKRLKSHIETLDAQRAKTPEGQVKTKKP